MRGGHTVVPARRIEGEAAVPGDKSISHRALLLGAIAESTMAITGLGPAADVASTLGAVRALGLSVETQPQVKGTGVERSSSDRHSQILVHGRGWEGLASPDVPIDVGNSGSTIRMLLGILSASSAVATLTGDASIRRRPMARVVHPLRAMGARIEGADGGDRAPLRVSGGVLHGIDHDLPVASAQVKSALLLAGLRAEGRTSVLEPTRSRDHTERMLRYLGVPIHGSIDRLIVEATKLPGGSLVVPGDLSSAAFLLVAAAIIPGSHVVLTGVGVNPTRSGILDILRAFGAEVTLRESREVCGEPVATIDLRAADRRPVEVAGELTVRAIDELPLVAVLGAVADGQTVVRDATELRVKESDRIAAMTDALRTLGADVEDLPDGFVVRGPTALSGGVVHSAGDHRIAMAMAVAALAAREPVRIEGWDAVAVSYPGFERDLERVVVR